jgi:hypothetical protein
VRDQEFNHCNERPVIRDEARITHPQPGAILFIAELRSNILSII